MLQHSFDLRTVATAAVTTVILSVFLNILSNRLDDFLRNELPRALNDAIVSIFAYAYVIIVSLLLGAIPFLYKTVHIQLFNFPIDIIIFIFIAFAAFVFYLRAFSTRHLLLLSLLNLIVFFVFCYLAASPISPADGYRSAVASIGYSLLLAVFSPLIFRLLVWITPRSARNGQQ